MFSRTTAHFVHRNDRGGSLIQVSHINDSDKLVPMALVVKKGRSWWQRPKYQTSAFTLSDLLKGKSPLSPGISETDFGCYEGDVVTNGKMGAIIVGGNMQKQTTYNLGKLKKEKVDIKKLHCDSSDRKVDMQHCQVRRLKKGDVLALLTERIITTSTGKLTEKRSCKGNMEFRPSSVPVCPQVFKEGDCVDGIVQRNTNDSMVIPAGTVIAYSLEELKIQHNGVFDWYSADGGIESDAFHFEEEGLMLDTTELQELPLSTRIALFQRFCEVMKDRDALSDVENTLEEWCAGDATVETEQIVSVSHDSSASAILDLLRPYLNRSGPDSHSDGTSGGPLTAVHLLVSAMEELPDEALILLSECSTDVLKAFNDLLIMLDLKDQQKSCSPLPLESLPLPLQDDKAFDWVQQLLIRSNVNLKKEAGGLLAERESDAGVMPLVLCVTVQGLSYLCDQQN